MLEVKNINVFYDQIHAIKDISFHIEEGELVALLGANGAGKSTTIRAVSGLIKPRTGSITYNGEDITRLPAHLSIQKGIAQSPEGRQIFTRLSVYENLLMGAYIRKRNENLHNEMEYIYSLFPVLKERSRLPAGALSGGEQQMLAIGRALMSKPKLLLLDEPSLGLAPLLVKKIFEVIQTLKENKITVLLVEQNVYQALEIADRAYVLETGAMKLQGTANQLLNDLDIQKVYLGG